MPNDAWRKSSHSGADGCVEVLGTTWRKSSKSSESANCVEVRRVDAMILDQEWRKATKSNNNGACAQIRADGQGGVQVRDSKLGEASPVLSFTAAEWSAFLDGAKNDEFEIA